MQYWRNKRTPVLTAIFLLCIAILTSLAAPASAATGGKGADSIWGANYFPDSPLVSHQGKRVRFFSDLIQGKVVVINFFYASCPDECALETARLRELQKILGDRVGKDVFIYSITIDPDRDTVKVLREYAEKFQAGPGWLFLTGKDADITQLRVKLGLYSQADKAGKLQDHNLSLIIGNQSTGQWMKISPHENPYILATEVGSWLHNWKLPEKERRDYAEAPKVRNISAGESLFRTRCSSCHAIGAKVAAGAGQRPIGPDLLNVTRNRNPGWLKRWLAEPDKMLAEKDPLAMGLLAQYNNIAMPNMRLNGKDIQALVDYIGEESARIERQPKRSADLSVPKDAKCPVCGMFVAKFPDWSTSIVYKNGTRRFFDGPKDLFKYYLNPRKYDPALKRSDIAILGVKDYYSVAPIDGRKSYFVIGSDVLGPMGKELIPFAKKGDAEGFLADHKGRKLLRFEEITPALLKTLD